MANIKTMSIQDIHEFIHKYHIIKYVSDMNLIFVTTKNSDKMYPADKPLRLFYGDKNKSKTIQLKTIMMSSVVNIHPAYVQYVYDLYGNSGIDITPEFVTTKIERLIYEYDVKRKLKEKRT